MLTTYGTAGSQTSYPSFMPGASDKVLKGADIPGISFPLSHVSAFAMGTFLVDPADILVHPETSSSGILKPGLGVQANYLKSKTIYRARFCTEGPEGFRGRDKQLDIQS